MKRNKIKPKYLTLIKPSNINKSSNKLDLIERKIINTLITFMWIILMLIWGTIPTIICHIIGLNLDNLSTTYKIIISFINDILLLLILIKAYYKDLKHNFKTYFNKNFKSNFKQSINYWLKGLTIMIISNFIIGIVLNGQITENEEAVRNLIDIAPFYMLFQLVIYAPLTEELIFRKSIKDIITNKYLFAIISGLIFGGLHVITSITNTLSLLYLIPYCALGITFGLLYTKSHNIFSTITVHAIHNFLALLLYLSTI